MDRNTQTLSFKDCQKIIDDFESLLRKWSCNGRIHFTGGDPLLYPYFFELLDYLRLHIPNTIIGILGNPELLTESIISELKKQSIHFYQMSIDGLRDTHDYLRHAGSFDKTIEKIKLLKRYAIKTAIMTTVSKINFKEIPNIVDLVVDSGVDIFDFHRFIPMGNGENIKDDSRITPSEFRNLLLEIDIKYQEYKNCATFLGKGEPLWYLIQSEKRLFKKNESKLITGGCVIGCSELTILENGGVLACRRLPIPIGKVPDQTLRDIFISSPVLNKMRQTEKLQKCRECPLILRCRGCRAISYAVKGDYFAPDPQCWR